MGTSSRLPLVRAVPVALLLALAAPAGARADVTLSVTGTAPHKTLTYTAGDSDGHSATATVVSGDLVITASDKLFFGCTAIDATSVNCGPAADFERVVFVFGW